MLNRAILFIVVVLAARAFQSPPSQPLDTSLSAVVGQYSLDAPNYLTALLTLAADFHLPMGIEWKKLPPDTPSAYVNSWQAVPLRTIIGDVVSSQPGYDFAVNGGVVHVYSTELTSYAGDILDVRLPSFEVQNEFVGIASRRLQQAVHSIMVPPNPGQHSMGVGGNIATGSGDRKISFRVQNVTVRDILDKLCLAADLNVWIVAYPEVLTRTPSGYIRTTTVMRNLTVEDMFQPTWIFIEWGSRVNQ